MSYEDQNSGMLRFQPIMHLTMGVFYLVIGCLVIYVKYFGAIELSSGLAYTLGGLMIIYGIFRLWRGFSSLKQRKRQR